MKKIITSIIILLVSFMSIVNYSYASGLQLGATIDISPDKTEVSAGENVTFTITTKDIVNATENGTIYAIGGKIVYDTNFFESPTTSGITLSTETGLFNSTNAVTEGGTNGTITLKVKDDATGSGNVQFTELTASDGRIEDMETLGTATTPDKTITISIQQSQPPVGGDDTTAPTVQSIAVTSPTAGEYKTGQDIEITTTFSEQITGDTVPTLKIKFGESAERTITQGTISGATIKYSYKIVDSDKGELAVTEYSGGTIKDLAGNNATISKKALTGNKIIANADSGNGGTGDDTDTVKPTVESIAVVSPKTGTYEVGQIIKIDVTFSEKITGDKVPTLKIKFGTGEERSISNGKINGNKIEYTYTIVKGDQGKLAVTGYTGGTIKDLAGNDATISSKAISGNTITADTKEDKSTANQDYHKAGLEIGIILTIIALAVTSVVVYSRYKKMRDI